MFGFGRFSQGIWLGVLLGLAAGALLPQSPLHAVAGDRSDTFAICTAPVDEDIEAIWFLDFLTGDLKAAVISPVTGRFGALYQLNIMQAMRLEGGKAPRYYMVSGIVNIRRGASQTRPSTSVVYVAEANSGRIAAFNLPWARQAINAGQKISAPINFLDVWQCRTAAVRASP
jgi:hypothetical protein